MPLKSYVLCIVVLLLMIPNLTAQNNSGNKKLNNIEKLIFYDYRGTNAFDVGFGTAVINGDIEDPEFEIYFKAGYKRFITNHVNIGISYNKYNLAFKDVYNEGFMSFDLNLEYIMLPYNRFSPFLFAGGGYNAANYFETTATKVQGGGGIEYIVIDGLGVKLFAEYNYTFTDELDGVIAGAGDDTFFRIGFGFNIYFGGAKKKERRLDTEETVIKSNPIIPKN